MNSFFNRSILSPVDLTEKEIYFIFELTKKIKNKTKNNIFPKYLENKSLAMIFQQTSTRTRVSFEVAMTQLGGHALFLNQNDLKLAVGETISDTARVLGGYVNAIVARVFNHEDVETIAKNTSIPVINAMTNLHHPCQALADIYTIWEKNPKIKGMDMAFVGDGDNNVTNSLLIISAILGINFSAASPLKYQITEKLLNQAENIAKKSRSRITTSQKPQDVVKNADIVATDIWTSPGKPDHEERLEIFKPFQLNSKLLSLAKKKSRVLHCLPAHRGQEITDEVIDGPQSAVWDEAENRLHIQKTLLLLTMNKNLPRL
jgi:ornithine carbamoyltransferase